MERVISCFSGGKVLFLRPRDPGGCALVTGRAGSVHCGLGFAVSSCTLLDGAILPSLVLELIDPIVALSVLTLTSFNDKFYSHPIQIKCNFLKLLVISPLNPFSPSQGSVFKTEICPSPHKPGGLHLSPACELSISVSCKSNITNTFGCCYERRCVLQNPAFILVFHCNELRRFL